jgi:isopentenyl-diphosphate delta-isomerase
MEEFVVLVDTADREIGIKEKLKAHGDGDLHRAFSICLFNSRDQLLLQQRAFSKYHSGGLWTNTCCSHPRPQEDLLGAAHRRLTEEMGIVCPLKPLFSFIYRAELDGGLTEHEFDHVFIGAFEGDPAPNPEEVASWKWIGKEELLADVKAHPELYTAWFKILLDVAKPGPEFFVGSL